MSKIRRRRNVLHVIRRLQGDPHRVRLKPVAPHSRDPRQRLLPDLAPPARPPPPDTPWPEHHQVDIEEYIVSLPPKERANDDEG